MMNQARLFDLVASYFHVDRDGLSLETQLREDIGADSLDVVELALKLEDELEIRMSEDEFANMQTLGDVLEILARLSRPPAEAGAEGSAV